MKTARLLPFLLVLSLTALPIQTQAQEQTTKRKNWFRRIFQRKQEAVPPRKEPASKESPTKPAQRKPVLPDAKDKSAEKRDTKKKNGKQWTEAERRTLEEYLKGKREGRADHEAGRSDRTGKKDKKNGGKGKGHSKGPGWKKRGGLPPGLQKKVDRGGELPPGWQKKLAAGEVLEQAVYEQAEPLPKSVFMTLPQQPQDTEIVTIEDKVVRVMKDTRRILDVFGLGDKLPARDKSSSESN